MSDSLQPCWPQLSRLLCPWDSPGKNTGVGCHALFQGIFLTQGPNPCLLHLLPWQAGYLLLTPPGKPKLKHTWGYWILNGENFKWLFQYFICALSVCEIYILPPFLWVMLFIEYILNKNIGIMNWKYSF